MCQDCSFTHCLPTCHERWDGADTDICEICDEPIGESEGFFGCGHFVCADCADTVTVDDLIRLCGYADVAELFYTLGFRRVG